MSTNMDQTQLEQIIQTLLGKYGWMFILAFFTLVFKDFVHKLFKGISVFIGNDINNDDIIYISGRQARVVRVTPRKTIFYMTDRGTKMMVPNDKLENLVIEKELPRNGKPIAKGPGVNLKKEVYDGKTIKKTND